MNHLPGKTEGPDEYDVEFEIEVSRSALGKYIPVRLNTIKLALIAKNKQQSFEPWQLGLTLDLIESVERNCEELLLTIGKNRLSASAWNARNLLELWVWTKFCGISRENAWRFHEDALRDLKDMVGAYKKGCDAMGIDDSYSGVATQRIKKVAQDHLRLEDVNHMFLKATTASEAPGVGLGAKFGPLNKMLSKFAHPTAGHIHGIAHQVDQSRQLQSVFTTQGVYFADQSTLALEIQSGVHTRP
jgi:hypothetical protein